MLFVMYAITVIEKMKLFYVKYFLITDSFIKTLPLLFLSAYLVPGTVLGTGETVIIIKKWQKILS